MNSSDTVTKTEITTLHTMTAVYVAELGIVVDLLLFETYFIAYFLFAVLPVCDVKI